MIFGVCQEFEHWQRLTFLSDDEGPFWVEQKPDGRTAAVSETDESWLEQIWEYRKKYPKDRRFPRTKKSIWEGLQIRSLISSQSE
jgi:hypothetical protein